MKIVLVTCIFVVLRCSEAALIRTKNGDEFSDSLHVRGRLSAKEYDFGGTVMTGDASFWFMLGSSPEPITAPFHNEVTLTVLGENLTPHDPRYRCRIMDVEGNGEVWSSFVSPSVDGTSLTFAPPWTWSQEPLAGGDLLNVTIFRGQEMVPFAHGWENGDQLSWEDISSGNTSCLFDGYTVSCTISTFGVTGEPFGLSEYASGFHITVSDSSSPSAVSFSAAGIYTFAVPNSLLNKMVTLTVEYEGIDMGSFSWIDVPCSGEVGMIASNDLVACRYACDSNIPVSDTDFSQWNGYWSGACGPGWFMCDGETVRNRNNACVGNWNGTYTIIASTRGTFWSSCGSGMSSAYTVTTAATACNGDNSKTGWSSLGWFDELYGGFTAGSPTCTLYGTPSFQVHSHHPDACSGNYCTTCAAQYAPETQGTLCCKV